jgi:lysine 2,3-aminomutase
MNRWNSDAFFKITRNLREVFTGSENRDDIRHAVVDCINKLHFDSYLRSEIEMPVLDKIITRDCARAWRSILNPRSEQLAGFSVLDALISVARGRETPGLTRAFWADIAHLAMGIEGKAVPYGNEAVPVAVDDKNGREAAVLRSDELDVMAGSMHERITRYESGLCESAVARRKARRSEVRAALSARTGDWKDWKWQVRHIARSAEDLAAIAPLGADEADRIRRATSSSIPFGVTPYYASLFDHDPEAGRDRSLRAQVIPPDTYIDAFHGTTADFMLEADTSPVDLITRRYTQVLILKPYNSCPQICVYCQRNWEIENVMAPGAMYGKEDMARAVRWIQDHDSIHEVLLTGGDPLVLSDGILKRILDSLAAIPHIERIRIGTRTPVTLPMRFTPALCSLLASYIVPGKREICVMTHVQHPYEVTPDLLRAAMSLRKKGIPVYNQLVYTFYVSRRFEAAALRKLIRLCGIDPYYTFYPKGKEETADYRVPVARLLQEQKEEARLLPGLDRTDEAVFNIPGLGKNHLNSWQHRDIISILPDGSRVYEFHPWEKKIAPRNTHIARDIPILDYLDRLEMIGEAPAEYESIWYYF